VIGITFLRAAAADYRSVSFRRERGRIGVGEFPNLNNETLFCFFSPHQNNRILVYGYFDWVYPVFRFVSMSTDHMSTSSVRNICYPDRVIAHHCSTSGLVREV
jgi:hypothetical protein